MDQFVLNTRGLHCPLPVLRAKKFLNSMKSGDVLTVEATDPAAPKDFIAFCEQTGNALRNSREEDGVFYIEIERIAP